MAEGSRGGRGGTTKNKSKPKDTDGNVMKCYGCESTRHLIGDCLHKKKREQDANYAVHITLFWHLVRMEAQ